MLQQVLDDIVRYLDFLRSIGYAVSVCCFDEIFSPCLDVLCQYEIHPLALCDYLKRTPATEGLCPQHKKRLLRKMPEQPYYGCCFAGVEEYVVPIRYNKRTIVCVNVSGYRGKDPRAEQTRRIVQRRYGLRQDFNKLYEGLSTNVPDQERIQAVTVPLSYMFYQLYEECTQIQTLNSGTAELYRKILQRICDGYQTPMTMEDIAEDLHYSASYLRELFREKSGRSIHAYLKEVRLKRAAYLLCYSDFTVTQIAQSVGFGDSNYFSTAFKEKYGASPLQYRKGKQ